MTLTCATTCATTPKTAVLVHRPRLPATFASAAKTMDHSSNKMLTERIASDHAESVAPIAVPRAAPTHPLGTLRIFPGEIREKIWKSILHNPLEENPSSMALLRSSKTIFLEAISELDHDLSVRFILDPACPLSILVRDGNNAKLPMLNLPTTAINWEHALWKIPFDKVHSIQIDIFPASTASTASLAILATTIDRLVNHLTAIWHALPPVHIFMRKSGPRVWWLDGHKRIRSVHGWQWDINICLLFFLRLRNCTAMKLTFDGADCPKTLGDVPWKIQRIANCIERAAVSTLPYGEQRKADCTTYLPVAAWERFRKGKEWGRWDIPFLSEAGNDDTIEHVLSLTREHVAPKMEGLVSKVEWPLSDFRFQEEAFPALGASGKGKGKEVERKAETVKGGLDWKKLDFPKWT